MQSRLAHTLDGVKGQKGLQLLGTRDTRQNTGDTYDDGDKILLLCFFGDALLVSARGNSCLRLEFIRLIQSSTYFFSSTASLALRDAVGGARARPRCH